MASVDEIWIVNFGAPFPGEPAKHRPALVIGPGEAFGPGVPFVIVAPLTTVHRNLSLHIEVEADTLTGLDDTSYIQCELIRSINRERLVHRIGSVELATSRKVATVIKTLLNY